MSSTSSKPSESTSIAPAQSSRVTFMGPAQTTFETFYALCVFSLDLYWPSWRNYDSPRSYILPPIFTYKHPDKSDAELEEVRREYDSEKVESIRSSHLRVVWDRYSDSAEHLLYKAIRDLVDSQLFAPFLAVNGLNLDTKRTYMGQLFPSIEPMLQKVKGAFREYDFVIIGPKIGIIVVEVKHSHYPQKRHFDQGYKLFPDDYSKGIKQLKSFDSLIELLKSVTEIDDSIEIKPRKVLFTPNLERERYDRWINGLTETDRSAAKEFIGPDIEQLFKEDFEDEQGNALNPLMELLQPDSVDNTFTDVYEKFAPIIAGLSSMQLYYAKMGERVISTGISDFDSLQLEAITRESRRIQSQDPWESLLSVQHVRKKTKLNNHADQMSKASEEIRMGKLILLTLEQQAALNGPNRQYITGAAGSGKTVILKAKALRMLEAGKSVLVLASKVYLEAYRDFFGRYSNSGTIAVQSWETVKNSVIEQNHTLLRIILEGISEGESLINGMIEAFTQRLDSMELSESRVKKLFAPVFAYDCIFIDDALDEENASVFEKWHSALLASLAIMTAAARRFPDKLVWIGFDPYRSEPFYSDRTFWYSWAMIDLVPRSMVTKDDTFHVVVLRRVMRCPENVYKMVYKNKQILHNVDIELGHKIQGAETVPRREEFTNFKTARNALRQWIRDEVGERDDIYRVDPSRTGANVANSNIVIIVNSLSPQKGRSIGLDHLKLKEELSNEYKHRPNIDVYCWYEVSSMEWPIVIYAVCRPIEYLEQYDHKGYRACSRATGKLVMLIATYKLDENSNGHTAGASTNSNGCGSQETALNGDPSNGASAHPRCRMRQKAALQRGGAQKRRYRFRRMCNSRHCNVQCLVLGCAIALSSIEGQPNAVSFGARTMTVQPRIQQIMPCLKSV